MSATLSDKYKVAKGLVKLFHFERFSFLISAGISVLLLIAMAVYCLLTNKIGWDHFVLSFLPAGGIGYASTQIIRMFTMCLEFIEKDIK